MSLGLRLASVLLALAFAVVLAAAQRPFQSQLYNITLTDQSPTLDFLPNVTGSGASAWNVSYSGSSWTTWNPSALNNGVGVSMHWTNRSGSSISFDFYGTDFFVWGSLYGGSTSLTIDGVMVQTAESPSTTSSSTAALATATPASGRVPGSSNPPPILAMGRGLTSGYHHITVAFQGQGGWEVQGVTLTLPVGRQGSTVVNTTLDATFELSLNPAVNFSNRDWAAQQTPGDPTDTQAFTTTQGASYTVVIPSNTSLLLIFGSVTPIDAVYSVSIFAQNASTFPAQLQYQEFQSLSLWASADEVLYHAVLVPGNNYWVEVKMIGDTGQRVMGLDSVVFVGATGNPSATTTWSGPTRTPTDTSSSSGPNVGAIAGGVVGGVLGLAILGFLLFMLLRRRKRDKEELAARESTTPFNHTAKPPLSAANSDGTAQLSASRSPMPDHTFVPVNNEKAALIAAQARREAQLTGNGHVALSPLVIGSSSSAAGMSQSPATSIASPISPVQTYDPSSHHTAIPGVGATASHLPSTNGTGISGGGGGGTGMEPETPEDAAAFRRKWEILAELGPGGVRAAAEASGSTAGPSGSTGAITSPTSPIAAAELAEDWRRGMPRADGRARVEMDAGRLPDRPEAAPAVEEPVEVLPPNYDPAWRSD